MAGWVGSKRAGVCVGKQGWDGVEEEEGGRDGFEE